MCLYFLINLFLFICGICLIRNNHFASPNIRNWVLQIRRCEPYAWLCWCLHLKVRIISLSFSLSLLSLSPFSFLFSVLSNKSVESSNNQIDLVCIYTSKNSFWLLCWKVCNWQYICVYTFTHNLIEWIQFNQLNNWTNQPNHQTNKPWTYIHECMCMNVCICVYIQCQECDQCEGSFASPGRHNSDAVCWADSDCFVHCVVDCMGFDIGHFSLWPPAYGHRHYGLSVC